MPVKLSVTIVAFNNYDVIKDAIASMLKYTSSELTKRVYIVDNGTTTSSQKETESFRSYINTIKDFEYVNAGNNIGFGKGNNLILDRLDSEYHAIVNPDILFCEDAFSRIVEWMDKNPEVGMTIPFITDLEGNRQDVYRNELTVFDVFNRMILKNTFRKRAKRHTLQQMDYSKPFRVPFGQGSFLIVRSDLFKELKGFDDNFFMYVEDADLCKRVNQVSKLMYYPGARVIHKWEKGSHGSKTLFRYHFKSMNYYFKKWGWRLI